MRALFYTAHEFLFCILLLFLLLFIIIIITIIDIIIIICMPQKLSAIAYGCE